MQIGGSNQVHRFRVCNHPYNAATLNQSKPQFQLELSLAQFSPSLLTILYCLFLLFSIICSDSSDSWVSFLLPSFFQVLFNLLIFSLVFSLLSLYSLSPFDFLLSYSLSILFIVGLESHFFSWILSNPDPIQPCHLSCLNELPPLDEKFKVQFSNTERLRNSAIPYMQRLLNQQ